MPATTKATHKKTPLIGKKLGRKLGAGIIDFGEIGDGETWELFGRDFLQSLGFSIEESPDRGPDGGRDLLVIEHLRGPLENLDFRWLVSCKHHARSKNSAAVSPNEEQNIVERLLGFRARGFLGIYSTVASSGLGQLLSRLRKGGTIDNYRVLDHKLIEHYLLQSGHSRLISRYFPESYRQSKPLHAFGSQYKPLTCPVCDTDLLQRMYQHKDAGIIQFGEAKNAAGKAVIEDVIWSCKGICSDVVERRLGQRYSGWRGLDDLTIPVTYLEFIWTVIIEHHNEKLRYSPGAVKRLGQLLFSIGQKVFREMTDEERNQATASRQLLSLGI